MGEKRKGKQRKARKEKEEKEEVKGYRKRKRNGTKKKGWET